MTRRLLFVLVNACSMSSLLAGMVAIFLAFGGHFRLAAAALLACVFFDGCDGSLARRFGVSSPFGAQLDSLADLGSFGLSSGVVTYAWLTSQGANRFAAGLAAATIAVGAAIRLARFNVSPKDGRFFQGVPTTAVAGVLALTILIGPSLPVPVLVAAACVYALAMVTSFPYAKLVSVARLPRLILALPFVCAVINPAFTFGVLVGAYLISGPLLWLWQRRRLRHSPALA